MDRHDTLLLASGKAENRKLLRSILKENYNLLEAMNYQHTMMLLGQNRNCIAAVLLDVSDAEAVRTDFLVQEDFQNLTRDLPLIVITEDDSQALLRQAFDYGAADVISVTYDSDAMLKRIETIVQLSLHKRNLEELVEEQAEILRGANERMVDVLSSIIEYRSVESGQHVLRMRHFTRILLEEVARDCPEYGLTERHIGIIASAAALHDIGKIAIPDAILTKPGKLDPDEWEIMKTHAATGCRILDSLGDMGNAEYLRYAHNICKYHHERWDGTGYPEGLKGDRIPICAQVAGLADAYDALTSKRVYKDAYSYETAANMILNGECGLFSPKLLECFKRVADQYMALAKEYADGLAPESESYEVPLPEPDFQSKRDGIEVIRAKYLALVHYVNVFLLEVDLDQGLFHLIYNPFPDIAPFHNINSFADIEQLMVEQLVVPEERQRMEQFIREEIVAFVDKGQRRASYQFRFRGMVPGESALFEVSLLRIRPNSERRTLAVLGRRVGEEKQNRIQVQRQDDKTYICCYDEDFTLVQLSEDIRTLAGYSAGEIREKFNDRLVEMILPEDRQLVKDQFREQLSRGNRVEVEFRVPHKDGRILWVLDRAYLVPGEDGREYLHCLLTDVSHTKQEMEKLSNKLRSYEIILAQTENVLFEWDLVQDSLSLTDTWQKLFGSAPVPGDVRRSLLDGGYFHPDDMPRLLDKLRMLETGSDYEMEEVRVSTHGGRYIWFRLRATAIRDEYGKLQKIAGIIINVDEEKQEERALQDRADRDSLTKLLNKNAARKKVESYLEQYPEGANCALLIIDIDNFKQINDLYGHLFGDAVLTRTAKEIKKLFRSQDIISRIGGDEFMVVMRGISDRELVENRCNRLLTTLRNAFREQHELLDVNCSIGAAMSPEHGSTYVELFRCADQALYQAKAKGKGISVFFSHEDAAFPMPVNKITAINNRIDSDEQPGLADNSFVQHALHRLYTTQDVNASINEILATLGKELNVSRVYIFENSPDNRFCSNTYEWCNEGIEPQIQYLQNISYETDIPGYRENFNEQGIFYCPDISVLAKPTYEIVAKQGIKSMLHCAILDNGVFRGYIGFDECVEQRWWTKDQINMLSYFSEMLSVFLLKKQEHNLAMQRADELSTILDNQNACIYIIDPDTCQLKYLNAKSRELAPDLEPGMACYEAMMKKDARCVNCPARKIREMKNASAAMKHERFGIDVLAEATLIHWQGEESCLVTCRHIPRVQET